MSGKRIQWIDDSKLLTMFLVVLIHSHVDCTPINLFIGADSMPIFFFLSGLTARKRSIKEEIVYSAKTILWPYATLYILAYLTQDARDLLGLLLPLSSGSIMAVLKEIGRSIVGMLTVIIPDTSVSRMQITQLWFLPTLFWCRVIFSIISHFTQGLSPRGYRIAQISIATAMSLMTIPLGVGWYIPFCAHVGVREYPFFMLASIFSRDILNFSNRDGTINRLIRLVSGIMLLVIAVIIATYNGEATVNAFAFGRSPLLLYIGVLISIAGMILLSSSIGLPQWTTFYSRNTLIILPFHKCLCIPVVKAIAKRLFTGFDTKYIALSKGLIVAVLALLLCALPIYVINSYLPWIIGKRRVNK